MVFLPLGLTLSGGLIPFCFGHDLALVVIRVVLDPVEGDGCGEHGVRDGEGFSQGQGLGTKLLKKGFQTISAFKAKRHREVLQHAYRGV